MQTIEFFDSLLDSYFISVNDYWDEIGNVPAVDKGQNWHVIGFDDDMRILIERGGSNVYLSLIDFLKTFKAHKHMELPSGNS